MSHILKKLIQQGQSKKNVLDAIQNKYLDDLFVSDAYNGSSSKCNLPISFFDFITQHGLDADLIIDACDEIHPRFEKGGAKNSIRCFPLKVFPTVFVYKKQYSVSVEDQTFNMNFCLSDTFYMGANSDSDSGGMVKTFRNVYPRKEILIAKNFLLGETEVTVDQWCAVMGGDLRTAEEKEKLGNLPIHSVTWYDAISFCNRLSEKLGLEKAYVMSNIRYNSSYNSSVDDFGVEINSIVDANVEILADAKGFRLPTSAEWEYAAKSKQSFSYAGAIDPVKVAWCGKGSNTPQPVKQKLPNAWGFYDMSGNVVEWCNDCSANVLGSDIKDKRSKYKATVPNPIHWDSKLAYRVARGGAIGIPEECSMVDKEVFMKPNQTSGSYVYGVELEFNVGFRVLKYI